MNDYAMMIILNDYAMIIIMNDYVRKLDNYCLFLDVSLSPTPSEIARLPTGSDTGELTIIK